MSKKAVEEILDKRFVRTEQNRRTTRTLQRSNIQEHSLKNSHNDFITQGKHTQSRIIDQNSKKGQQSPQKELQRLIQERNLMELSSQFKEHIMKMQRFDRYMYPIQSDRAFKIPVEMEMKRLQKIKNSKREMRGKLYDNELTVTALYNHVRLVYEMTRQLQQRQTLKAEIKTLQKTVAQLRNHKIQQVRTGKKGNRLNQSINSEQDQDKQILILQAQNQNLKHRIKQLEKALKEEDYEIQREKQTMIIRIHQLQQKNQLYQSEIAKLNFNAAEMMSEVGKIMSMENEKQYDHLLSPKQSQIKKRSRISSENSGVVHQGEEQSNRIIEIQGKLETIQKIIEKWLKSESWEKDMSQFKRGNKGKLAENLENLLKTTKAIQKRTIVLQQAESTTKKQIEEFMEKIGSNQEWWKQRITKPTSNKFEVGALINKLCEEFKLLKKASEDKNKQSPLKEKQSQLSQQVNRYNTDKISIIQSLRAVLKNLMKPKEQYWLSGDALKSVLNQQFKRRKIKDLVAVTDQIQSFLQTLITQLIKRQARLFDGYELKVQQKDKDIERLSDRIKILEMAQWEHVSKIKHLQSSKSGIIDNVNRSQFTIQSLQQTIRNSEGREKELIVEVSQLKHIIQDHITQEKRILQLLEQEGKEKQNFKQQRDTLLSRLGVNQSLKVTKKIPNQRSTLNQKQISIVQLSDALHNCQRQIQRKNLLIKTLTEERKILETDRQQTGKKHQIFIHAKNKTIQTLQEKLLKSEKHKREIKRDIDKLQEQLIEGQESKEKQKRQYTGRVQQFQLQIQELSTQNQIEKSDFNRQVHQLAHQKELLIQQMEEDQKNHRKQKMILNQQLQSTSTTDKNKNMLYNQIEKLSAQILQSGQAHQNQKVHLRKNIDQLNAQIQNLIIESNQERRELREQIEIARNQEHKNGLSKLKKVREQLKEKKEENERLVEIIDNNQNNFNKLLEQNHFLQEKRKHHQAQQQSLIRELEFYKDKLEECEQIMSKLSPMEQKIKAFDNVINGRGSTQQISQNQTMLAMQRLCHQNEELRNQLYSFRTDGQIHQRIMQLQSQNEHLKSFNSQFERDLLTLRAKNSEESVIIQDRKFAEILEKYEKQLQQNSEIKSKIMYFQSALRDKESQLGKRSQELRVLENKLKEGNIQNLQCMKDKEQWHSKVKQYQRVAIIDESRHNNQIENFKQKLVQSLQKFDNLNRQSAEIKYHQDKDRKLREQEKQQFNRRISQLEHQKSRLQKQLFEKSHLFNQKANLLTQISSQLSISKERCHKLEIQSREELSRVLVHPGSRGEHQANRIMAQNTDYRLRLQQQTGMIQKKTKELYELKNLENELRKTLEERANKLQTLMKENYEVRLALADQENLIEMEKSLAKAQQEALSQHMIELNKQIHMIREETKRSKLTFDREKERLSQQIQRLKEEIEVIQIEKVNDIRKLVMKLQQSQQKVSMMQINNSRIIVNDKKGDSKQHINMIQFILKQKEGDLSQMKEELRAVQSRNSQLSQQNKALREDKLRLQSSINENAHQKSLNANLFANEKAKLEAKILEINRIATEKATHHQTRQNQLKIEIEKLNEKIQLIELQRIDLQKFGRTHGSINQRTGLTQEKESLASQLSKSQNEIMLLKNQLSHQQNQLKNIKNQNMNLKFTLNDEQQKSKLSQLNWEHLRNSERQEYENTIRKLQRGSVSLHNRIKQMENEEYRQKQENQELKSRVVLNEKEINNVQSKLSESLQHQSRIQSNNMSTTQKEIELLRNKNTELIEMNKTLISQRQESLIKAKNYKGQIQQLKLEIRQLSKTLKISTQNNQNNREQDYYNKHQQMSYQKSIQNDKERLNKKLQDLEFRYEQLFKEKNALQSLYRQLTFEKEKMKDEIQRLYRELDSKSSEYLLLRASQKQLRREREQLKTLEVLLHQEDSQNNSALGVPQSDVPEVNILWKVSRQVEKLMQTKATLQSICARHENSVSKANNYSIYVEIEQTMNSILAYLVENEMVVKENGSEEKFKSIQQIEDYLGESLPTPKYWTYLQGFAKDLLDNVWNLQLRYIEVHQNVIRDIKLLFNQYSKSGKQEHLVQIQKCLQLNLDI